jgi:hypothetical protein
MAHVLRLWSRSLRPFCQGNCFGRSQMRLHFNARYAKFATQQAWAAELTQSLRPTDHQVE